MYLDVQAMRQVIATSLLVLATGYSRPGLTPCDRPAVATADWQLVGGTHFKLRLPVGFQRDSASSFDSEVGAWGSQRAQLWFDFGAYSNTLDDSLHNSGTICHVTIGGRPARMVMYRDSTGQYAVGAHWTQLRSSSLGPISLTLSGRAKDSTTRDSLVAALWSVTFNP